MSVGLALKLITNGRLQGGGGLTMIKVHLVLASYHGSVTNSNKGKDICEKRESMKTLQPMKTANIVFINKTDCFLF
jgi:hypothetical protein